MTMLPMTADAMVAGVMERLAAHAFSTAEQEAIVAEMRHVWTMAQHAKTMEYVQAGVTPTGDGSFVIVGGRK